VSAGASGPVAADGVSGGEAGGDGSLLRVRAHGGPPLGLIFGGIAVLAGAAVTVLRLDRVPFVLCAFKQLTGLPCPTCGSTRTLGRLAELDVAGAFAMNPLVAASAMGLLLWALADLALLPRGRALRLEARGELGVALRGSLVLLALANWAFLILAGR